MVILQLAMLNTAFIFVGGLIVFFDFGHELLLFGLLDLRQPGFGLLHVLLKLFDFVLQVVDVE